jgi:glycosyltransferase involved in cell wall biosynthesis
MSSDKKRAAHFLLSPDLAGSPPNEAIVHSLLELGYAVDLFTPDGGPAATPYGPQVTTHAVGYGRRWLIKNALSSRWRGYSLFSGTSEDPLAVVGALAFLHRRPSFALVDEIKSGSYRGDSPEYWKRLCRWGIRQAGFSIVNDSSRIPLLRDYAGLRPDQKMIVYPGCFHVPPAPDVRADLRKEWGVPDGALVIASSGGFNLTAGAQWLIGALQRSPNVHAVIQPLGVDALARFLLQNLSCRDRMHVEDARLGWKQAWASAAAFDVGLAVYTNPAPQFQNMGISSNRLCMYLAMGVPVIASRQPSFRFLEEYGCGVLVDSQAEFDAAIEHIRSNLDAMKANALKCAREYIDAPARRQGLKDAIRALTA